MTRPRTPNRPGLQATSHGRPAAVLGLARLLLQLHQRPPARLVATAPAARAEEPATA